MGSEISTPESTTQTLQWLGGWSPKAMVTFVWSSEQEEALHVQLRWKQPCLLVHMAQRQHGIRVVGETPFRVYGRTQWLDHNADL